MKVLAKPLRGTMKRSKINIEELIISGEPVQLHLGCGKRFLPGFLHIDQDDYDHIDYRSSISSLEYIPSNSVHLIYCCHALEYFDYLQVNDVLKEWSRVLKPNGILRISVPDFEKIIKIYSKTKNMKLLYGFIYGRYLKENSTREPIYHKTIFTLTSLKEYLLSNGFGNVREYKWQDTIHRDYDDYSQAYIPHMDKDNGELMSINVEANKKKYA